MFLKNLFLQLRKDSKMAMKNGPLAGYEVDSMKVTLKMVLSTLWILINYLLRLAAKMGYKAAAKAAKAKIMEPIMKLEVLLQKKTWEIS